MDKYKLIHRCYALNEIKIGKGSGTHYLIPIEISKRGESYYVSRRKIEEELDSLGWNLQEYYDVFILNIDDISKHPKCIQCGKEIDFGRWSLSSGYQRTCGLEFGEISRFCCISCSDEYRHSHPEEYPEYHQTLLKYWNSGGTFKMIHEHPELYPEFHKNYKAYLSRCKETGGTFRMMYDNIDTYPEFKEAIHNHPGIIQLLKSNPDKYKESLDLMEKFYKSGGAFGHMWSHHEDYPNLKNIGFPYSERGSYESPKGGLVKYQSSWEKFYCKSLDVNDSVLKYYSQPFFIPYEYENKLHRYRPDVLVYYTNGKIDLIEIKPLCFVDDEIVQLKANAAKEFCRRNNYEYRILTELDLFG